MTVVSGCGNMTLYCVSSTFSATTEGAPGEWYHEVILLHYDVGSNRSQGLSNVTRPSDADFRTSLRTILERSGFSMRQLSAAMGRDPGYVAALLDPTRPSRARPTPADLVAASDTTGIPLVDWLRELWAIDPVRLADDLARLGVTESVDQRLTNLAPAERTLVLELIDRLTATSGGRTPGPG